MLIVAFISNSFPLPVQSFISDNLEYVGIKHTVGEILENSFVADVVHHYPVVLVAAV